MAIQRLLVKRAECWSKENGLSFSKNKNQQQLLLSSFCYQYYFIFFNSGNVMRVRDFTLYRSGPLRRQGPPPSGWRVCLWTTSPSPGEQDRLPWILWTPRICVLSLGPQCHFLQRETIEPPLLNWFIKTLENYFPDHEGVRWGREASMSSSDPINK